jgi:hypothetical protein
MRNDSGDTVARTILHADPALDAKLGRPLQLFGLTEFADDGGVAEALFDAICAAGRASGKAAAFGPVALLPNQSGGVITSGFDSRGFIDSAWNHDYYPAAYEKYGFAARFEADTWICPVAGAGDPGEIFGFEDARFAAEDLELHRGDRRHIGGQLPILREMLNASLAQLGYYTEISAEQLARQTDGLASLLDESLLLYLTKAGRPIANACVPAGHLRVRGHRGRQPEPGQPGPAAGVARGVSPRRRADRQGHGAGRAGPRVHASAVP